MKFLYFGFVLCFLQIFIRLKNLESRENLDVTKTPKQYLFVGMLLENTQKKPEIFIYSEI